MLELFIEKCYDDAVELKKQFKITENKEWTVLIVINELFVQVGHYSLIICNNEFCKEFGRNIINPKDELADILLQLCALCEKLNIDKKQIKIYATNLKGTEDAVLQIVTLIGQITETVMEIEKYRHSKERIGFETKVQFIIEKINKCFSIIFEIAEKENYDMISEFFLMKEDALKFLNQYKVKKYV